MKSQNIKIIKKLYIINPKEFQKKERIKKLLIYQNMKKIK